MIVEVLEAGAGPGDFARVRLSTEPDGVNPPDVFELTVGLKPVPRGGDREFDVELLAGTATDFAMREEDPEAALSLRLYRRKVVTT